MSWRPGVVIACLCSVVAGCGGSSSGPSRTARDGERAAGATAGRADEGVADDATASVSPCADGTCLECGAGLCPKGFYCDEKAPGGAACSWLPECGATATCECVKRVLGAACDCSEKPGGPSLTCP